ncbi:MAG: 4-(cytidine 5'-diphospho)-2-C-methyl-D-erythritol kinase [Chitinophagaceae bacterium]|nr:4-(cytidine 5'-diphospho)-2-C-methyl-D-erythritol kinase [Chitinophagaceae bacterium]
MIVFPNCKINLGLNILRKREDGFHDLETVFFPLPLRDIVEIIELKKTTSEGITLLKSGFEIAGENNICIKAYDLLKKRFPHIPAVQMHLHKAIPVGGGLGGGSADGAFALMLLNEMFGLAPSKEELRKMGAELGSDCPFFIINKPCFSQGRGELLEEIEVDLSAFKFIIVNPGIHIDTGDMFKQIKPAIPKTSLREIINLPVEKWKDEMKNDFEEIVFALHPEIGNVKEELYKAGAVYASMSGSGSTVFGIFSKERSTSFSFPPDYFIKELTGQAT